MLTTKHGVLAVVVGRASSAKALNAALDGTVDGGGVIGDVRAVLFLVDLLLEEQVARFVFAVFVVSLLDRRLTTKYGLIVVRKVFFCFL